MSSSAALLSSWKHERAAREDETARLFAELVDCEEGERDAILNRIIEINACVARSVARRYRNRDIALEDLEQVACLALVRAAHRFDPSKSDNFLTFAVPTITGEVRRHFRDHGWTVRPPRRVQEVRAKVSAVRDTVPPREDGRPASEHDIAQLLDLPVAEVSEALSLDTCFSPDSLDVQPLADGSSTRGDLLPDASQSTELAEVRALLAPALARLSARERHILHLRFVRDLTQSEIGEQLGVSQVQVSRLLGKALATLRDAVGATSFAEVA
ncbi:sigma-70 family RNA polymerase sigma factor [Nocardioides sp. SYSU D00038]|uniref:sigma-70 family RNA polymerase sigma factor n=1 Tax=Nocardioides sp. SYSU D00038 TaxID=2812554 RepID=UPI0019674DAD|nr:sigma-70 family RNA polymerase sigma factor [Nocardioides sp. SYSU D00038]